MSPGEAQSDGARPGPHGPAESLAELTDAQRQSVAAASDLFEQLLDEVRQRENPQLNFEALLGPIAGDGNGPAALGQLRAVVSRAIDLYADLLGETFSLYADALEQMLGRGGGGRSGPPSQAGSPVELTATPGGQATVTVWLHNGASSPLAGAELRLTGFTAHDGGTLDGVTCAFSPPVLDVDAGSSGSAVLSVTLAPTAVAGAYHGLVLASGAPAASVAVFLTVR